jgi:GTP-binding protein EngB required for normal cell division
MIDITTPSYIVPVTAPSQPSGSATLDALTFDMKGLIKKIQDLRNLGIEDSNIALPKICVVGDQSTGKSSLIEAISEIKVPRSEGTCTRCPLEINLAQSDVEQSWHCIVSLSRPYHWEPNEARRQSYKKTEVIGRWVCWGSGSPDNEHFCVLTDRSEIAEAIKWAQTAILNPDVDSQTFVPGKNAVAMHDRSHGLVKNTEEFSPNIVRLNISGPDLPTLSFYDLPGVIRQAKNAQENYLVRLIEDLVKKHAADQDCIVLLTRSMTGDAEVSSAGGIIQKIKGAEARTIGVLTKPDRLAFFDRGSNGVPEHVAIREFSSFNQWIEILEGKSFALGHGYYVVKNNPDPDVSHAQARQEETLFFSNQIWSIAPMNHFRSRLGVKNLQNALSNVLMDQIQRSLPSIIKKVNEKAKCIDDKLKDLPETPREDAQRLVTEMLTILYQKLRCLLTGSDAPFSEQEFAHLTRDFKTALSVSMPAMTIQSRIDDFDIIKREPDVQIPVTPSKRKAFSQDETSPPTSAAKPGLKPPPEYTFPEFETWNRAADRYSLSRLRDLRGKFQRAGAPNQTDPRAVDALNKMSAQHWDKPLGIFVSSVHQMAKRVLLETLEHVMGPYRQTELFRELSRIIEAFLNRLKKEYYANCMDRYNAEIGKPFTLAEDLHKRKMEESLRILTDRRSDFRLRQNLKENGENIPSDEKKWKSLKEKSELGPDEYWPEIEMMAVSTVFPFLDNMILILQPNSRAYYSIASLRFADVVCQNAYMKVFWKCQEELVTVLRREIDANCECPQPY